MTDLTGECWRLMFNLVDSFREKANKHNKENQSAVDNITVGQLRILKAVASFIIQENTKGIMLKTLAEKVALTPGATSIIVDSLVKNGLLEREHCETDRRAVNIALTKEGQRKMANYIDYYDQITREVFAEIPEEDRKKFHELLQLFYNKVK